MCLMLHTAKRSVKNRGCYSGTFYTVFTSVGPCADHLQPSFSAPRLVLSGKKHTWSGRSLWTHPLPTGGEMKHSLHI